MRTAKTADMINNMVKFRVSGSAFSFLSSTCSSSQPSGCLFIPNHSEQKRMSDPSHQRLFQFKSMKRIAQSKLNYFFKMLYFFYNKKTVQEKMSV